jgi:secreted trypsin-like serine protease
MKHFTFLLIIIIHCFHTTRSIQFGQDVTYQNKYPFYIMIGNPHVCGGTLISYDPPLILTAAHCVDAPVHPTQYTRDKNPYFVLYNDIHRDKHKAMAIIDWTIHPLYNISGTLNIRYDAAIIQLESPLQKSARIKRVPFWSPSMSLSLPSKAELVGFGYSDLEGNLAQTLQLLPLDITKFNPNSTEHIESRSETENQVACHGDSGGPLIVYHPVLNPSTNDTINVPYVLGDLTRIFGARDARPDQLTCPIALKSHTIGSKNTVVEVFTNAAGLLDWISSVSGISKEDLSNPFYTPPHPPCKNCHYKTIDKDKTNSHNTNDNNASYYDADDDDEVDDGSETSNETKQNPLWRISVVTDENGLLDTEDSQHFWIGSMVKNFLPKSGSEESIAVVLYHTSCPYSTLFMTLISFIALTAFL